MENKNNPLHIPEELEKNLKKTEFGRFLGRHTVLTLGVLLLLTAVLISVPLIQNKKEKGREVVAQALQDLDQKIQSFETDKLPLSELLQTIKDIDQKYGQEEAGAVALLEAAKVLAKKGQDQEALNILEGKAKLFSTNPYLSFFINKISASLFENLGKTQEAIDALEVINGNPSKLFAAGINFDLGRLYEKQGNQAKAQEKFQAVLDGGEKGDEITRLAELKISELNSKQASPSIPSTTSPEAKK